MLKTTVLAILSMIMIATALGCEEEYQIETDEEFQQAVDNAVEDVFRAEIAPEEAFDGLVEEYSDRYSDNQIIEYVEERLDEKEEELLGNIDTMEQRTNELEEKALGYVDELEKLVDVSTMKEIEEEVDSQLEQIEALSDELEATEDVYEMISILEEMESIFEDMVFTLEETLHEAEEGVDEQGANEEPPAEEEVRKDLIAYVEKIEPLGEHEIAIVASHESVTGEQYEGDEVMHSELTENIIPAAENLLSSLRAIEPQTSKVRNLHQEFIEGWEKQLESFNLLVEALEQQDDKMVDEANQVLERGSQQLEHFNQQLNRMVEAHEVQLE